MKLTRWPVWLALPCLNSPRIRRPAGINSVRSRDLTAETEARRSARSFSHDARRGMERETWRAWLPAVGGRGAREGAALRAGLA